MNFRISPPCRSIGIAKVSKYSLRREITSSRGQSSEIVVNPRRSQIITAGQMTSGRLLLWGRRQRNSGLGREQEECHRLLEVEPYNAVGMARITNRDVLPDLQIEITAARGEHEGAGDCWGVDDLVLDELFDMLQDRIPVIAGFGESRIGIGAQQQ
jgi:hypothetical protein